MKTLFKTLLPALVLACLLLSGCSASSTEDPDGGGDASGGSSTDIDIDAHEIENPGTLEMRAEVSGNGLILTLTSTGEEGFSFGEGYWLDVLDGDEWKEVPPSSHAVRDVVRGVTAGETYEQIIDFSWNYDKLSSGRYRISKRMWTVAIGDSPFFWVRAEFDIP